MSKFPVEIKDGYVLKCSDGILLGVYHNDRDELCVSSKDHWCDLNYLEDLLNVNVVEIYGRSVNKTAHKISTEDRKLLWKRDESGKSEEELLEEFNKLTGECVEELVNLGIDKEDAGKFLTAMLAVAAFSEGFMGNVFGEDK